MKTAKILKYLLMAICTIIFSIGIYINHSHYRLIEWIITLSILFIFLAGIFVSFTVIELDIKQRKEKEKEQSEAHKATNATDAIVMVEPTLQAQYIETKNGIMRADGKPFADEEVPFLIQRSYEKTVLQEIELKKVNPAFSRTDREETMAFNFAKRNAKQLSVIEDRFQDLYRNAYRTNDLTERIKILESAAIAFKEAQNYCYGKGNAGRLYFQDTWEYMHNSQKPCFSYLDNIMNSIYETKRTRDVIIPAIFDVIRWHDGILQKDIYALLPNIDKREIQDVLKKLEFSSNIIRTKRGNSYELHINNQL